MTEITFTVATDHLRDVLDAEIARAGSLAAAAGKLGISVTYLRDVLKDRRSVSALAGRLGYRS